MAGTRRDQSLEALRIIAIFGVVAFHTKVPFADIPYAGLIVFVILSPFVDARYNWHRVRSIRSIAKTYLLPWLVWSAIYGAINVALRKPILPYGPNITGILAGSSLHLWFLPAMFVVIVGLNLLKRAISAQAVFWGSFVGGAISTYLLVYFALNERLGAPYAQWVHAAPAVFVGLALGLSHLTRGGRPSIYIALATMSAAMFVFGGPGVAVTYPLGILAVVIAAELGSRTHVASRFDIQPIAACTLGVYLTHMIFVMAFNRIIARESYLTAASAFIVALATVWVARRFTPASKVLLG